MASIPTRRWTIIAKILCLLWVKRTDVKKFVWNSGFQVGGDLTWGYGDMVRLSKFSSNGGLACGVLINEMLHGCKPTWPSNMDWNGWKSFWTKSDLRFRLVQKLDVPQYVPQLIWMIQINRWIVIDRSMRIFIGKWFVRTGISGACHWGNRKAKPGNIRGPPRKRGDN